MKGTKVTPKQKERMQELREKGLSYAKIAAELSLNIKTVFFSFNQKAYEKYKQQREDWKISHPGYFAQHSRAYIHKQRLAVIALLGGVCSRCEEDDIRLLQVNHIGSRKEKYIRGVTPVNDYRGILLRTVDKDDLNLLCGNCNVLYEYSIGRRVAVHPVRNLVITKLGGRCANCGISDYRILEVNHLQGGGRKEMGEGRWYQFYKDILDGRRDTKDLNLLCANCNILYEYEVGRRHNDSYCGT